MKARQANAAASATKHRAADAARRDAIVAFENAIAKAVEGADVWQELKKSDAVRDVVDGHKERIKGKEDAELKRVKQMVKVSTGDLAVIADSVGKARDVVKAVEKRYPNKDANLTQGQSVKPIEAQ